jgi:ABC-2 type transport system ATP-binding protein
VQNLNDLIDPVYQGDNPKAVQTFNLTKRFKKQLAVNNVNLEIYQGDVFGLLGPNGAGKTTIIRMLIGLVTPTEGKVRVLGYDAVKERARVLAQVSAIVETPALYPGLSGLNNLKAMALVVGLTKTEAEQKIAEVLDKMGLSQRAGDLYRSYSLGMKQRLCIAAALLTDPQIIILDEPTNGLDPAGMAEMRQLIWELAGQGRTVILSSHLLNEVQQVCNRVAIIQKGQIIAQGLVTDLLANKTLLKVKVRQDEWVKAWDTLIINGWGQKLKGEGDYLILDAPATQGINISRILATQGIFPSEIIPQGQSLEDYFLDLTANS